MKSDRFTLFVLLVEIVVIGFLHSAKSNQPPAVSARPSQAAPPLTTTPVAYQWNNNFTLIRLK